MNVANEQNPVGTLFILSAPSGTGKTTLAGRLVKLVPDLVISRSYTSRVPRAEERDGVDYNFVSRHEFEQMVNQNQFLDLVSYAVVYAEFGYTVIFDDLCAI